MANLLGCCGIGARRTSERRPRYIIGPNRERVSSYYDLEKLSLPIARSRRRTSHVDKYYPVEIIEESKDGGYCKVHYKGWHHRYDEWKKKEDIRVNRELETTNGKVAELKIDIKNSLRYTKTDSKVFIRMKMDTEQFEPLRQVGIIFKETRMKTIFTVDSRQSLEKIFGVGWDYLVQNQHGDSYYIKTVTVRFWLRQKKNKTEFNVYPDHLDKSRNPTGH
ncbi:uncharacterized protein LOC117338991 [Pecten maximus]|uniref:uncharacterized protein LOC117338991 n=1 Tax=Pecten maximus TaxID=6579 RepID=UPI0014581922|nr:uncharacterized protein LOC117338991 [Pecten maximus]